MMHEDPEEGECEEKLSEQRQVFFSSA